MFKIEIDECAVPGELRDQADKDFLRILEIKVNKKFEISLCLEINKKNDFLIK